MFLPYFKKGHKFQNFSNLSLSFPASFQLRTFGYLMVFLLLFPSIFLNTQSTLHSKPRHGSSSHYIQPIAVEMKIVLNHFEDAGEKNEENI